MGEQNPHCTAPLLTNALAMVSLTYSGNPSGVKISVPSNVFILMTQANFAFLSISTVQAPQTP